MHPRRKVTDRVTEHEVSIPAGQVTLDGTLERPQGATSVVLFAHGSGSSRHSPRNLYVARVLRESGVGTLLFDLLTAGEESVDDASGELRFDIPFLAKRLEDATRWIMRRPDMADFRIGYFGASTGAAAALVSAAELGDKIDAVVSRGGRPDLAGEALPLVKAPTLLLVGGEDGPVIGMNRRALAKLGSAVKRMVIVPRATHLFEEPGTLEEIARLAAEWFKRYLSAPRKIGDHAASQT